MYWKKGLNVNISFMAVHGPLGLTSPASYMSISPCLSLWFVYVLPLCAALLEQSAKEYEGKKGVVLGHDSVLFACRHVKYAFSESWQEKLQDNGPLP